MFRNVLVGIDAKTRGRDAIALARLLLRPGGEISFAHVSADVDAGSTAMLPDARELVKAAIHESGIAAQPRWISAASVGAGLRSLAAIVDADLIVVGASSRSHIARVVNGNPTTDVLRAHCMVAVAPHDFARTGGALRKIAAAYDGSGASNAGVDVARTLALELGAEMVAYYVASLNKPDSRVRHDDFERAVRNLAAATKVMKTKLDTNAEGSLGEPVAELSEYSKHVDLLVITARGRARPFREIFDHSTTEALTDRLHCPLVVVTKGARKRAAAEAVTTEPQGVRTAETPGQNR